MKKNNKIGIIMIILFLGLFNTLYMSKSGGGTVFLCAYKNNVLIYDNIHFDRHYYDNAHIEEVDSIFKTKETFEL